MNHTASSLLHRRGLIPLLALLVLGIAVGAVVLWATDANNGAIKALRSGLEEEATTRVVRVQPGGSALPAAMELSHSISGEGWSVEVSDSLAAGPGFAVVHWDQDAPTIAWIDTRLKAVTAVVTVSGPSPGVAVRASANELLVSDTAGEGRLLAFDMANGLALKSSTELPGRISSITGLSPLQLTGNEQTLLYIRRAEPPVEPDCSVTSISGGTFPCDNHVLVSVSLDGTPSISPADTMPLAIVRCRRSQPD